MNKLLLGALLTFLCTAVTPGQSSSSDWSGFYAGGSIGPSSDKVESSEVLQINQVSVVNVPGRGLVVVPATTRDFTASRRETNWTGSGHAGYNWQAGKFVFGPEVDFSPFRRTVRIFQTFELPPTVLTPVTTVEANRDIRVDAEFSFRARAGAAFGKTLIYGTGGYGLARVRVSANDSFTSPGGPGAPCSPTPCVTADVGPVGPVVTTAEERQYIGGWVVGGGVERKLGDHVSIGFEYRHTDFPAKTFTLSDQTTTNTGPDPIGGGAGSHGGVVPGPTRVSLSSDSFVARFSFHF